MSKSRTRKAPLVLAWVASSIPVLLGIKLDCPGPPLDSSRLVLRYAPSSASSAESSVGWTKR